MTGPIVVLTGASGVGKTTIALEVERSHPEIAVFRFDTIGVPSAKAMAAFGSGHQPGGAWQRAMTLQWFHRIAEAAANGRAVLFEGQMRLAFALEAISLYELEQVHLLLVECDDATRDRRLIHERRQPELASESMRGWSRYLHDEAVGAGVEILDTGVRSLPECIAHVVAYLRA